MSSQAKRRTVFIDRKFQSAFVFKFLFLLLAGTLIFDIAAYFILNRRLEDTLYSAHLSIRSVGEILLPVLLSLSIIFIVILGAAVLVMTLLSSHLIAGPLHAIRRYIDHIGEGDLDFCARLREKDQALPLISSLCRSLDVLNERLSSVQSLTSELNVTSRSLMDEVQKVSGDHRDELEKNAATLIEIGSKLSEESAFFKTRSTENRT